MHYMIRMTLFAVLTFITTALYAVKNEGICVDITYPLDECEAIRRCPDLCELHSQAWTGAFGTSTTLCEDQQREGNSICICAKK